MSFRKLYQESPQELKQAVFSQWKAKQNPQWHPEGNTLKHIIVVTNRAFKNFPDNKNIQLAAYFHDLGKLATYDINPKTGLPTAYGHEEESVMLVDRFKDFIEQQGANPEIVKYIVKNHMKIKPSTWDVMRPSKKDPILNDPNYQELEQFGTIDKGGLLQEQYLLITKNKMQKQPLPENFRRWQQLAGILTEATDNNSGKKKLYVLVGPPSVGKSTYIKNQLKDIKPYIINRDDLVEKVAQTYGWTYDDMFTPVPADAKEGDTNETYGTVVKSPSYMTWAPLSYDKVLEANNKVATLFNQRVQQAKGEPNIVVDMTNMTAGSRKGALKAVEGAEDEYHKVAVVFNFEGAEDIIKKVAAKRAEQAKLDGKSKTIPPEAFDRMFKSFQNITSDEGFDEVIPYDNIGDLKKSLQELNEQLPNTPADVTNLNKAQAAATTAQSRAKNINTVQEFPGAFENWFKSLGYQPGKISKGLIRSEVEKVLAKLGYK